jgi:type II secretory pathway pseudopilin PulG
MQEVDFQPSLTMTAAGFPSIRATRSRVRTRRPRAGFSLLEMIVMLILVGIVASISGGRLTAMRAQQQVTRASSVIQTQLEKAFAIAGRNRQPMEIVWNSTLRQLSVTNRAGTLTYGQLKLGSDYGLRSGEVTSSATSVEVYPNGLANGTLTITIQTVRGGRTYTKVVSMNRAGLVKVS